MLKNALSKLRKIKPLVLNITNEVTINDCASAIVAIGGGAIMSSEVLEIEDLVKISSSVNINIGTVNKESFKTMNMTAFYAKEYRKASILDLVGLGASKYRNEVVKKLLKNSNFSVLKGNVSEIKALVHLGEDYILRDSSGVDVRDNDKIEKLTDLENINIKKFLFSVKKLAERLHCIIIVTGAIDLIINKDEIYAVENGHPMMSRVCGTGCMLSGILAAFLGINLPCSKENLKEYSLAAVCIYDICGELAFESIKETDGPMTYKKKLIDFLYNIKDEDIEKRAKYCLF